jgi:hypothetical protein
MSIRHHRMAAHSIEFLLLREFPDDWQAAYVLSDHQEL